MSGQRYLDATHPICVALTQSVIVKLSKDG
jgi:hypothetical protein